MPLTRSRDNLVNLDEPTNVSFTVDMDSSNANVHQVTQPRTSRKRTGQPTQNCNSDNTRVNETQIRQIVSDSLGSFRTEMMSFISNELSAMVQNINVPNNGNTSPQRNVNTRQDSNISLIPTNNNNSNNSNTNEEPILTEKVLNIIRNWRIKFTGHDNQISVSEFIYRINILTTNNLKGDFDILCKHAHILFESKALEWYWRYQRQTIDNDWHSLTTALRSQYKEDYTDFDILDDIRRRKQRNDEKFDDYLDTI